MPSKPKVSFKRRFNVLKKLSIFSRNGELKTEKSYVWVEATRRLNCEIQIHNLYISVLQNRNNLLSDLQAEAGIIKKCVNKRYYDTDTSDESDNSADEMNQESDSDSEFEYHRLTVINQNPHNCQPKNFHIVLNAADYTKVKPIKVYYKNNPYSVNRLNYGWTDIFVRKISSSSQLKCAYSLKKQTVYNSESHPFFDFYGRCRECKTFIYGYCNRKYLNRSEGIVVHIQTFDTSIIPHKGKRFLKGAPLRKARKTLKYMKASRFRQHVAGNFFGFGDPEPPDLQTTINLRKARERAIDKELDMKGPKDVYSSLEYLANQSNTPIRQLQEFPFVVKFNTDNQINIWKNIAQKGRLCVSMDASGSFVKMVRTRTHETKYILFYAAITIVNNKIVPLQQMLTEKHDTNIIKMWLSDALRQGAPIPDEVVTDGSLALLGAVSLSYNKCTYRSSLENGYQYAFNEKLEQPCTIELVRTWIRQDRAHIIKACARWPCFKKTSYHTKDIYLRIIGFCVEIEDLNMLEDVLFAIFILSESRFIVPHSESQKQVDWIMERIKTFDRQAVHDILRQPSEADCKTLNFQSMAEFNHIVTENNINNFIQAIYKKAKSKCDNELTADAMTNTLWCPDIKDHIFYLYAQAPAWTNLLRKAYKSPNIKAVSAGSEAHFKNLKNLDWITYPISANKFVKNQIEQIEATVSFAQNYLMDNEVIEKYKSLENKSTVKVVSRTKKSTVPKSVLINEKSSKKLSCEMNVQLRYEDNEEVMCEDNGKLMSEGNGHLTCEFVNEDMADVIIINGNNKVNPVIIEENGDKTFYYTIHTCPIDSLAEICSFSYLEMNEFKIFAENRSRNNSFMRAIISYCTENCNKRLMYQNRAKIMKPIAMEVNGRRINCQYNVSELLETFFTTQNLITRTITCSNCTFIRIDSYSTAIIPISEVNNLKTQGMLYLQRSLNLHFCYGNSHCSSCKTESRRNFYVIDTLLAVNLEYLFLNGGKVSDAYKIPIILIIQKKKYKLSGVVAFHELHSEKLPLHYYAFLRKNGSWEKRDDMVNRIETMTNLPRDIKISLALYVINNDQI